MFLRECIYYDIKDAQSCSKFTSYSYKRCTRKTKRIVPTTSSRSSTWCDSRDISTNKSYPKSVRSLSIWFEGMSYSCRDPQPCDFFANLSGTTACHNCIRSSWLLEIRPKISTDRISFKCCRQVESHSKHVYAKRLSSMADEFCRRSC